jgi:NADH:ubiquinone oxidoreductase subunit F (NADH-binding)
MTMTRSVPTVVAGPEGVRRLFAADGPELGSHLAAFGPAPHSLDASALLTELERSGLAGRGGAGFPTWRKLAATESAAHDPGRRLRKRAVVIANGAEGEPLSRKDETLLRAAPHLILDGLLLVARSIGTKDAVLYAPSTSLAAIARAVDERQDARGVRLVEAPETFLSGEATAVVNAVGGGPAIPRDHVRRMAESGLGGPPTLVQNVETLAHIALIARFGADWFRSQGTDDEAGTRLVSVSGDVATPQVFEVPGGASVASALVFAGAAPRSLRAVLVGGYHGAWLPAERLDTALSVEGLAPFGAAPGAGILMALGADRCGLEASAEIATYLASQSARQCGPCANGLPRLADVLTRLAAGDRSTWLPGEVRRLAALVAGRGSCHHPDGTARLVLSSLTVFSSDVQAHLAGRCEAQPDRRIGSGR